MSRISGNPLEQQYGLGRRRDGSDLDPVEVVIGRREGDVCGFPEERVHAVGAR